SAPRRAPGRAARRTPRRCGREPPAPDSDAGRRRPAHHRVACSCTRAARSAREDRLLPLDSPAVCAPGSGHSDDSRTRSRPETTRRATRAAGGPAGQRTGPPRARGDRGSGAYTIAGIGSVAEVVQSDRRAGGVAESVLGAVEAVAVIRDGVGGGAGLLGGLDGGVPVTVDAGARRDQLADDHVLLEAHQLVRALVD